VQQESIRQSVEKMLSDIQRDNSEKLERMRQTVDEKLHKTLETRLGESFKLVNSHLSAVQKGLGEMQSLASDVGDLKKVLTNVKTKGNIGEYQLEGILEQILTPNQFVKNYSPRSDSRDVVEFAIKLPSKAKNGEFIYLPLDSKFPTVDYERLLLAYDVGNQKDIEACTKALVAKIKSFAKDIQSKYIFPPATTDFGIMFLPIEGLYAEVLRIPGLFEMIQREYHVTITGPTTVSAFLSSLQMGFRTLQIEQHTDEVWRLLETVKREFSKFGDILEKTREKLEAATKEISNAESKSRTIERKLRDTDGLLPQ
jgi:DNA recombination protein RmuC